MPGQFHAYDLQRRFLEILTASLPTDTRLDQILHSISETFQSDRSLLLRPDQIDPGGLFSGVVSEKKALWVEDGASFPKENLKPEEASFLCPAFVCIPLSDGDSFLGVLYLSFSKPRHFLTEEVDLLFLIAKGIGEMLRNKALHLEAEQTIAELTALHTLGKAMVSTLKLDELLEIILRSGLKILGAKGGVVRFGDKETGVLKVRFSLGGYDQNPLDEEVAHRVFIRQTPLSLNPFDQEMPSLSILCAPLFSKGKCLGTLAFYEKEAVPSTFDDRDFQLLLTMANQVSCAIENAMAHDETFRLVQEHEKSLRRLSTLCELNKTLLTTVHLERILQMTLTAITIREGLGFNRAMLFLVDEKNRLLKGKMAIGPDSAGEAGKIWEALSQKKGLPSEVITQMEPPVSPSQLDLLVKGTEIPLDQNPCVVAKAALEGRPFNIRVSQSGEGELRTGCKGSCCLRPKIGCYGWELLGQDSKTYAFAAVPVWGKGKVIGVILVDNLYNQNPIKDVDVQFLSMFANQAGLAIENGLLYRNLEAVHHELEEAQAQIVHQEKMAALGELSNAVAHEIKNPLTAIGGFARRLDRTLSDSSPEKRYTQTIIQEVARLEKVLGDINHYTHEASVTHEPQDLVHILEDSLSSLSGELVPGQIEIVKEFSDGIPKILGDYLQLKQAVSKVIKNACESMGQKGILSLRLYPFSKNGSSHVRLEMKDTGRGIDSGNLPNIFNPFYSTKETSLGLGLPIVHKIVTFHKGQIEIDNRSGEGVTFRLTFPAMEGEGKPE